MAQQSSNPLACFPAQLRIRRNKNARKRSQSNAGCPLSNAGNGIASPVPPLRKANIWTEGGSWEGMPAVKGGPWICQKGGQLGPAPGIGGHAGMCRQSAAPTHTSMKRLPWRENMHAPAPSHM